MHKRSFTTHNLITPDSELVTDSTNRLVKFPTNLTSSRPAPQATADTEKVSAHPQLQELAHLIDCAWEEHSRECVTAKDRVDSGTGEPGIVRLRVANDQP